MLAKERKEVQTYPEVVKAFKASFLRMKMIQMRKKNN